MSEQDTTTTAGDESTAASTTEAAATEADPKGAEALGDAGKKALDTMKADRNQARQDLAALRAEFDAFRAKADGKEAEHLAAVEAQRVKDEALAAANERIKKAEVRAQAANKLNDPKDALRFLDLSAFEVDADGEVDGDAIARALDDLIKDKPYLAAQSKRFTGDADGGARNESAGVPQLTRADMERMTPEQIVEAQNKGQFANLLGSK